MGRGRDFRGGGKGRGYHAEESDAPAAPSDRHSPRPFGGETMPDQGAAVEAIVKWFSIKRASDHRSYLAGTSGRSDAQVD
jgi:hypothetical protein